MNARVDKLISRTVALFDCLKDSEDAKDENFYKNLLKIDFRLKPEMFFTSVDDLTQKYPEFKYTKDTRGTTRMYRDLEKLAASYTKKHKLPNSWENLEPEIDVELDRLLNMCNLIKMILCVSKAISLALASKKKHCRTVAPAISKSAFRVKGFVLKVLMKIFNVQLSNGGPISPLTTRVSIIYHRESGTKPQKRMSKAMKEAFELLRERLIDSEAEKVKDIYGVCKLSADQSSNDRTTALPTRNDLTGQSHNTSSTEKEDHLDWDNFDSDDLAVFSVCGDVLNSDSSQAAASAVNAVVDNTSDFGATAAAVVFNASPSVTAVAKTFGRRNSVPSMGPVSFTDDASVVTSIEEKRASGVKKRCKSCRSKSPSTGKKPKSQKTK